MAERAATAQPRTERAASSPQASGLTIGELAQRTGLSPAVLRMWETRHGVPVPQRMPSGHRRYAEADVELIERVLRRKAGGARLDVAIAEARAAVVAPAPSIFAELRRRHPTLAVQRLSKRTLVALSRAIEDECFASAASPVVFGAFQRSLFYDRVAARWAELARVARGAYVFAEDWPGPEPSAGPHRVTLPESSAMRREWAVVCDGGESAACLSAWEVPGQGAVADRARVFEAIWTLEPGAVRTAARAAASVAAAAGAPGADLVLEELAGHPAAAGHADHTGEALFGRVLAYLDRRS